MDPNTSLRMSSRWAPAERDRRYGGPPSSRRRPLSLGETVTAAVGAILLAALVGVHVLWRPIDGPWWLFPAGILLAAGASLFLRERPDS